MANLISANTVFICGPSWCSSEQEDKTEYNFKQTYTNLEPNKVVDLIQRSKIGLILSDLEGGNFSSAECLLCGVPVLTTPSYGGRDHYFCGMNSRYCEPNQEDVMKKFNLMLPVNWNAEKIREYFLNIVKDDRERFVELTTKIFKENNIEIDARKYFFASLDAQQGPKRFYSYNDI